ncbi:MAG: hypothetical protein VYD85_10435 [Pseudomonadota bacterium]|nr:hypothetical protein [Pseudomonadota bacterium]
MADTIEMMCPDAAAVRTRLTFPFEHPAVDPLLVVGKPIDARMAAAKHRTLNPKSIFVI